MDANSKYKIERTQEGFIVSAQDRRTTIIQAKRTGFMVKPENGEYYQEHNYGLFEYYALSACIADTLMLDWKSPRESEKGYTPAWAQRWARKQTAAAIGKRVYHEWQDILSRADPQIKALQKRVFAVTRQCPPILHDSGAYETQLASDALKYRAAAITFVLADKLAKDWRENKAHAILKNLFDSNEDTKRQLQSLGMKIQLSFGGEDINTSDVLLMNWRELYSDTGKPYRSLNRTLMNLPGRVPLTAMVEFSKVHLQRPVTDRLELTALLMAAKFTKSLPFDDNLPENIGPVWHYATRDQIARAMQRVSNFIRQPLSPNKTGDINRLVSFLRDGEPENYAGTIVGLADRSIEYHRDRLEERRQKTIEELGGNTKTAAPPISLPKLPGVTFLDSVGRVVDEGADMDNCVADYSRQAVEGYSYLFHVEKNGERATVEVSRDGQVKQSQGPSNRDNAAARWGKRVLNGWGKQLAEMSLAGLLPEIVPVPVAQNNDDDFPF